MDVFEEFKLDMLIKIVYTLVIWVFAWILSMVNMALNVNLIRAVVLALMIVYTLQYFLMTMCMLWRFRPKLILWLAGVKWSNIAEYRKAKSDLGLFFQRTWSVPVIIIIFNLVI